MSEESNINDAAESSWNEMQQAFGSSTGGGADASVPVEFLQVDLGGKMQHVEMESSALGRKAQGFARAEQT